MRCYQILLLDRLGKVREKRPLACESDDAALERTAFIRHQHAIELWEGERQVWHFEAVARAH